ncbi:MAG: flagellar biosynthetic protein FliO [bacterium]|nr:flagellar biosynthetic protein FliO [bacterium]
MRLLAFFCTFCTFCTICLLAIFCLSDEVQATSTQTTSVPLTQTFTQNAAPAISEIDIENQPVFTNKDKKAGNSGGYKVSFLAVMAKTVFALIIIGLLIIGLLKFFFKDKAALFSGVKCINTLATHPLSPNKYIQIVEINNKIIILGITESNINLLTEITDRDDIDLIKLQCSSEPQSISLSFIDHLTGSVKKMLGSLKTGEQEKTGGYGKKIEFLKTQHDRLKKLEG